jgi:CMP-N-acetylneuraminic acid synthetase
MIPARLGSQRLSKKNLKELGGVPLIKRTITKCKDSTVFDEIWVNSESEIFKQIAEAEDINFHQRPKALGNNEATSEQYISEFLQKHQCDWLIQVHSIAPLLSVNEICAFVEHTRNSSADLVLSYEPIQIECVLDDQPVNFSFYEKTNSQDLKTVKRISWSISAWHRDAFLSAVEQKKCASYCGKIDYFPISQFASHVIKTQEDLDIAEALLPLIK